MNTLLHNDALGKLILRLTVGVLTLFHGVEKITNPGTVDYIGGVLANSGLPSFLAYGVYVGEVIAPLMVVLGIYCRYARLLEGRQATCWVAAVRRLNRTDPACLQTRVNQ